MKTHVDEIARDRDAHGWSKLLATWRLCDNAACRRARVCRGQGDVCLKAKFPLLPEAVREWFMGFVWHKQEQIPFDDMLDNLEELGHGQALRDWLEGVQAQAGVDATAAR